MSPNILCMLLNSGKCLTEHDDVTAKKYVFLVSDFQWNKICVTRN